MLRWSNANFCCDFNVFEKGFSWENFFIIALLEV
jgi:hypothetical protein